MMIIFDVREEEGFGFKANTYLDSCVQLSFMYKLEASSMFFHSYKTPEIFAAMNTAGLDSVEFWMETPEFWMAGANIDELLEEKKRFPHLFPIAMHAPIFDLNPCSFNPKVAELSADCTLECIEMLEALGFTESGLDKVVKTSYDLLGLMSFLTAGEPEVRAWTIKKGTKAPAAAGKIHSDIERGFIRAEIVSFDDLVREGSMVAAREKGLVRQEGKEYIMQDGDIVLFKFNV